MPSVRTTVRGEALALAALLAAAVAGCSRGPSEIGTGAGTGGSSGGAPGRELAVVGSQPADGAVQVPVDAELIVRFDGPLAGEALDLAGTGLFVAATGEQVPVTTELRDGARTAVFHAAGHLDEETDMELRLAALTHDRDGRVLDDEVALHFRTVDRTPPAVTDWSFGTGPHPVRVDAPLRVRFDEALDPASVAPETVALRDPAGRVVPAALEPDGAEVRVRPVRDLPGSFEFVLSVRGVADRSGNRAGSSWSVRARTPVDDDPPRVVRTWPGPGVLASPTAAPRLVFSESMAFSPGSTAGLQWLGPDGDPIPFDTVVSTDGRTLHLVPRARLLPGTSSFVQNGSEDDVPFDVSGNALEAGLSVPVRTGSDASPPRLLESVPAHGAVRVPPYVEPVLAFDEALDPRSVDVRNVSLARADGAPVPLAALRLEADGTTVRLVPAEPLELGARHVLTAASGLDGVRDAAGNVLPGDIVLEFTVNEDPEFAELAFWPADEAVGVPLDSTLVFAADRALDPATLGPDTVTVTVPDGDPVAGRLEIELGGRAVRFRPSSSWEAGARYRLTVRGGAHGVRGQNGNWLPQDRSIGFRVGYRVDGLPPRPSITIEHIAEARSSERSVPTHGFAIDVGPTTGGDPTIDPTTIELTLTAAGGSVAAEQVSAAAEWARDGLRYRVTAEHPLPQGSVTARARVADLSGNFSDFVELRFDAAPADVAAVPFERTQLVWVRFDLDRDGNGRSDFDDDLVRLGLATDGDPLGANARLSELVRDGVLARCHALFGRTRHGAPVDRDSVAVRVTPTEPRGLAHMQIACGGFDPEGSPGRDAGDPSTGTLGRAWYDFRNETLNERNTATSPGLGVFGAELWLFEVRVHSQVYPSFVTAFAERYLPLAPALGGTPAGRHALDRAVLAPGFDPASASGPERARWETILRAADDWATAIGVILAHEIGHSVGLTAPGTARTGLHGDASLHNAYANTTDVMAAAVGFDALVSLEFRFRDLNVAYLRQRVVLR